MEIGSKTGWTVLAYFPGRMGANTKVNILMTKNTAMENSTGPMGRNTKANGKMENSTELGHM